MSEISTKAAQKLAYLEVQVSGYSLAGVAIGECEELLRLKR